MSVLNRIAMNRSSEICLLFGQKEEPFIWRVKLLIKIRLANVWCRETWQNNISLFIKATHRHIEISSAVPPIGRGIRQGQRKATRTSWRFPAILSPRDSSARSPCPPLHTEWIWRRRGGESRSRRSVVWNWGISGGNSLKIKSSMWGMIVLIH